MRLTETTPPLTALEIGEIPTTEVSPEVDAGFQMDPPAPSEDRRYPFGVVPDEKEMMRPVDVLAMVIGAVAESVDAETLAERVANSFVSIHCSVGSTGAMSASNSS